MKTLSSSVILLFISLTGAYGFGKFPDTVVLAEQDESVTIPCNVKTDGPVTWRFTRDGDEEKIDDHDGFNLTVSDVDAPMLGEYSCWNGAEKLSSAYLRFEAKDEKYGSLHCRAKSYNCNFSCKWNHSDFTAVRLGLGHSCTEGEKSCTWINSTGQHPDGGLQFEIIHSLNPCEEEKNKLEVTAEAMNSDEYLKITKRFYLREIVQPDPPKKLTCQEMPGPGQNLNVTITAASSWSGPHSYFRLEHEIEYVERDNGKTGHSTSADIPKGTGHSTSAVIPKGITQLRARSREALQEVKLWSKWSDWINVRAGKKKQCKKTANCCCPPRPSKKNRRHQTMVQ